MPGSTQGGFADALPGLSSGGGGMLRRSVVVEPGADAWKIMHSIWELSIPSGVVLAEPDLQGFLERSRPAGAVRSSNQEVAELIRLLLGQGCATYDGGRSSYTLAEVRYLISSLCNRWYGEYYRHPFWRALRECRLSTGQLFAWALRTYHLSRSAGPTAARGGVRSANRRARVAFAKSALEEYAHCDEFYLPQHPVFGLERDWIVELVPTASSTAFDQQMAVIAAEDWVAHACAAFFQEYTASFREQAFALYDKLEAAYGLAGFFKGWKDHVGYDVDHTHADDFGELFAGNDEVEGEELRGSVANAAATVEYLLGALDELSELPPLVDLQSYRVSPAQCAAANAQTDMLSGRLSDVWSLLESEDTGALGLALLRALDGPGSLRVDPPRLSVDALADLAMRALSTAESHDDIVALGKRMEVYLARGGRPEGGWRGLEFSSAGDRAIYNFVRENARHSPVAVFLFDLIELLEHRDSAIDAWRNGDRSGGPRRLGVDQRVDVLTRGAQFLELVESRSSRWMKVGSDDLLV